MMQTTVNDESLNNSLIVSAGLHVILLLFLYFGLPHLLTPLPEHHDPVPFEIVELADITNTTKEQQQPDKAPAPPPKPAAKSAPAQTVAPPTPQTPVPDAESLKVKPLDKPKPPDVKPKVDPMEQILKNVEKMKPKVQSTTPSTEAKTQPEQVAKSMAPSLSNRLTISEEDLLRRQIEQCWNPPIGAKDVQSLVVEVVIAVNPDRTVQRADIVDMSRYNTDSYFRAAADAARRAVMNPRCSPLELPPDKYDQWKVIDFNFDPRDML